VSDKGSVRVGAAKPGASVISAAGPILPTTAGLERGGGAVGGICGTL
jgi:hypothetical protein